MEIRTAVVAARPSELAEALQVAVGAKAAVQLRKIGPLGTKLLGK